MKTTIVQILSRYSANRRRLMNHPPPLRSSLLILPLMMCFVLLPAAQAVVPAPDGCYPNYTTAEGCNALNLLTTGAGNTGVGWYSLFSNTDASFNTGLGAGALALNNGDSNTAVGAAALLLNTSGTENVAIGTDALVFNGDGIGNTAVGAFALSSNTTGFSNTATGGSALGSNTMGVSNTGIGRLALGSNTSGQQNTAIGVQALHNNTTGSNNTALGRNAGFDITGSGNVCIGSFVDGVDGESDTTRIRNVGSTPIVGGTAVVIDGTGGIGDQRLGFASSSRRYKKEIRPMNTASASLFALKPVTFRAKGNTYASRVKHYGLIAEDVARVDPNLVVFNPKGEPETLHFDSINAMLLNEFLKEHKKVQELENTVASLAATVKEQATQIQKVSAQLKMHRSAAKVVVNQL